MAKRFTDTVLWEKEWFAELSPAEKCAWFYIKDRCDSVGVWEPSLTIANFYIGEKIDWDAFRTKCNGNISILDNGKWWLVDFCFFQYGILSVESTSPTTKSYIKTLQKHGLLDRVLEGYPKGIDRVSIAYPKAIDSPKDKDKEKDKDKVKDKEKDSYTEKVIVKKESSLFQKIQQSFEAVYGQFTNYPREGKAINRIIEYAKGNEDEIRAMLETFLSLTKGTDKFWSSQPFTPSTLAASGIWDRVKIEAEKQRKSNDPWWEEFESGNTEVEGVMA